MIRRFLQTKWFAVALAGLVVFFGVALGRVYPRLVLARKEAANLSQKIAELKGAAAELVRLKENFQSPAFLERQARLKLNYKKPDEKVVFVYQNPYNAGGASGSQPIAAGEPSLTFWQKFRNWLISKWRE